MGMSHHGGTGVYRRMADSCSVRIVQVVEVPVISVPRLADSFRYFLFSAKVFHLVNGGTSYENCIHGTWRYDCTRH